jgi:hypothetical protein
MPSDFNSLDGTLPTPGAGRLWFLAGRCGSWRPRALQRAKILARAAYPQGRSSHANSLRSRVLPEPTGVITTSQVHRLFRGDDGRLSRGAFKEARFPVIVALPAAAWATAHADSPTPLPCGRRLDAFTRAAAGTRQKGRGEGRGNGAVNEIKGGRRGSCAHQRARGLLELPE